MVDALYRHHRQQDPAITRDQVHREFTTRQEREADILSPVWDQCQWLRDIGFIDVDCFFKSYELAVFDADHAGTTYGQESDEVMRRVDHLLTSAIATHPDICRQMPRYLKTAGFILNHHSSDILSECGRGDFWLSSVRGFAGVLPALNILSEEEGNQWAKSMSDSHDNGTFFAAGAYYTLLCVCFRITGRMTTAQEREQLVDYEAAFMAPGMECHVQGNYCVPMKNSCVLTSLDQGQ